MSDITISTENLATLLNSDINIRHLKIDGFIHQDNWPQFCAPLNIQEISFNIADRVKNMSFFNPSIFSTLRRVYCWVSYGDYIENLFDVLSKLPNLSKLELHNTICGEDFQKLGKLTELTEFNLEHCNAPSNIENFPFPNLTALNVSYTNKIISNETLGNLPNTLLVLEMACSNITDLSGLSALPNIQKLDISSNNIRDFSPIQFLTSLQSLRVSFTGDYMHVLFSALNRIQLRKLQCWRFVYYEDIGQLPQSITEFDISFSKIDDSQLLLLIQYSQIEKLTIDHCGNISIGGLCTILDAGSMLKKINMKNLKRYSYEEDLNLKEQYPEIEFVTDFTEV